jgi:hypothetical protein
MTGFLAFGRVVTVLMVRRASVVLIRSVADLSLRQIA